MSSDVARRAAWVVAGVAALAGVALSLVEGDTALAAVAVAVGALVAGCFLSLQIVIKQLAALQRSQAKGRQGAKAEQQLLKTIRANHKEVTGQFAAVGRTFDAQPYLSAELVRRYEQLIPSDQPVPTLGANWAATAPTILFIVDQIMGRREVRSILECGSGASTLWAASAFRKRGGGHVYTLDHDAEFAEITRQNLRNHGLESYATVIDAPLVEVDVPGRGVMRWYDLSGLPEDIPSIDLLFVDGPPRPTGPEARYPAFPMLRHLLHPGSLVVLDDTNRRDERVIAQTWSKEPGMRRFMQVGRSAVLEVVDQLHA